MKNYLIALFGFGLLGGIHAQCTLGPELVTNGNFSAGNVGFTSDYAFCNVANCLFPEGRYAIGSNATFFHGSFVGTDHTTGAGNFYIGNGSTAASDNVWCQTVAVTPGANYVFEAWYNNVLPPGFGSALPILQFFINEVAVGPTISVPEAPDVWQPVSCGFTAPVGLGSANLCIRNFSGVLGGNDFGIDDISFRECTSGTHDYCASPLPASVLYSSVSQDGPSVKVAWSVNPNVTIQGFRIERSRDAQNWETAGAMTYKGNASYQFYDLNPLNVKQYYRIIIEDASGVFQASEIHEISYFPASSQITLRNSVIQDGQPIEMVVSSQLPNASALISIFALDGRIVYQEWVSIHEGTQVITLSNGILPSGLLIGHVSMEGYTTDLRIIVQ